MPNQNPEQIARDQAEACWIVQDKKAIDFSAGLGIAVREYQTDIGPADYVLFVAEKAVGVIEAKPNDWAISSPWSKSNRGAMLLPLLNG